MTNIFSILFYINCILFVNTTQTSEDFGLISLKPRRHTNETPTYPILPRESGSTSSWVTLLSTLLGFLKQWKSMANKDPSVSVFFLIFFNERDTLVSTLL